MRASRCLGFAAVFGWACCAAGCDSDDDSAPSSAGTGGAQSGDAGSASGEGDAGDANAGAAGAAGATAVVPYANVVSVSVAAGSEGAYVLSVSIESSDLDCTQFANWWEVVTEDGALAYRRILEHSHTDANRSSDADQPGNTFTRLGGPVPITADAVVLVRAHLSTGGYNGQVMRQRRGGVRASYGYWWGFRGERGKRNAAGDRLRVLATTRAERPVDARVKESCFAGCLPARSSGRKLCRT